MKHMRSWEYVSASWFAPPSFPAPSSPGCNWPSAAQKESSVGASNSIRAGMVMPNSADSRAHSCMARSESPPREKKSRLRSGDGWPVASAHARETTVDNAATDEQDILDAISVFL